MKEQQAQAAWYQKPIWQGLLGLALMVAGWKLSTYVPPSPGAERLAEMRRMAGEDAELAERLDRTDRNLRGDPPYQLPGRVVLVLGLALFVGAGVRMYNTPVRVEEGAENV